MTGSQPHSDEIASRVPSAIEADDRTGNGDDLVTTPRVLIVADHASLRFGGEAALPYHYFRVLRRRGVDVRMIVHERCRNELETTFPEDRERFAFVANTALHRWLHRCGRPWPSRLSYATFGLALRLVTQWRQKRIARQWVREHGIEVVHQPMPVSPKEPSLLFGLGVPVVMGPMNGGMAYPPAFASRFQSRTMRAALGFGRMLAGLVNMLVPGKRQAALLLVANPRTARALPRGLRGRVVELVENGVDLERWQHRPPPSSSPDHERPTRFIWVGRMVDWKAVDLVIDAFTKVVDRVPCELELVGDGPERVALEAQAASLGLRVGEQVRFAGWQPQEVCAQRVAEADVMVLPSLWECGGAVVLEAMAMGRPVVATRWGGVADYLNDQCGILIEPTSRQAMIDGFAEAMVTLGQSPAQRRAMGKAGWRRVVEQFDWELKADRILKLYREVIPTSAASWDHP